MKRIFLYGDISHNFKEVSAPFIQASGGSGARVALLLQGGRGWGRYVPRYRDPWLQLGAEEVIPVVPTASLELDTEAIESIKGCTGLFVAGGDTRTYHRIYANRSVKWLIKGLYEAGVPYGGASAGALIAPHMCIISGEKYTTESNEIHLRARHQVKSPNERNIELIIGEGIGLLDDCVIDVHFSEFGGFPRLLQSMEITCSTHGFGIDEQACLEIREGQKVKVHGRGRIYYVVREDPMEFKVKVLEPRESYEIGY